MRIFGRWLAMGLIVAAAGAAVWWIRSAPRSSQAKNDLNQPQCGHWCVRRCCELLGAPVELSAIMKRMPAHADGHSLLVLSRMLKEVGFQVEGRRETLASLKDGPFPVIAHLQEPNHFVVIASFKDEYVHVFDGAGRRTRLSLRKFRSRFSGNVLYVKRDPDVARLPAFRAASTKPAPGIQFETLFTDCGEMPANNEEMVFSFPFRNVGTRPLAIKSVKPSCSCLSLRKPEAPVPPGRSGSITLTYRPETQQGPFYHDALVQTNDPDLPTVEVKLAGWVDRPLEVSPTRLDFGEVAVGEIRSRLLIVHGLEAERRYKIVEAKCSLAGVNLNPSPIEDEDGFPAMISPEEAELIGDPRELWGVRVSVAPKESKFGLQTGKIRIRTNLRGTNRLTIPVRFHVVPPVQAFPSVLSFGKVAPTQTLNQKVTLIARDRRSFRILRVEPALPDWEWTFPKTELDSQANLTAATTGTGAISNDGKKLRVWIEVEGERDPFAVSLPVSAVADRSVRPKD